MQEEQIQHYKNKLKKERKKIVEVMKLMVKNKTVGNLNEIASELSFYDNHPSDCATEISEIEKGNALMKNEEGIVKKIDKALENISKGTYGICKNCGDKINENRLEYMPYAEYCTKCQNEVNSQKPREKNDRPVEEEVLGNVLNTERAEEEYGSEFNAKDCYQRVESFNKIHNIAEIYDEDDDEDYVEPIEKISNDQYKNQLP